MVSDLQRLLSRSELRAAGPPSAPAKQKPRRGALACPALGRAHLHPLALEFLVRVQLGELRAHLVEVAAHVEEVLPAAAGRGAARGAVGEIRASDLTVSCKWPNRCKVSRKHSRLGIARGAIGAILRASASGWKLLRTDFSLRPIFRSVFGVRGSCVLSLLSIRFRSAEEREGSEMRVRCLERAFHDDAHEPLHLPGGELLQERAERRRLRRTTRQARRRELVV